MSILYVNLEKNEIRTEKDRPENGYALLKALMDERKDRIAFTSINGDALRIKGASSALFAFNSPLKGRVDYGYAPLYLSFMLFIFTVPCLAYCLYRGFSKTALYIWDVIGLLTFIFSWTI